MSFYLSEAYSDLYNPRVESNFDDNLRFIDFMEEEDIEEVVESLLWEICDYGNSLEESFSILSLAASDEIITEAYEEILSESRSQVMARRAQAAQGLQTQKARLHPPPPQPSASGDLRKQARRTRIDGAISRVKSAIAGARGGMGRASKALGGAVAKARSDGKARLGQLLRRGVKATGRLLGSAGRAIGKAGQQSSQSGLASRRAGRVGKGGQMSLVLEPTAREKTGGVMSKVGRGLSKAGDAVSRMGKEKPSGMSRSDDEARKAQRTATAKSGVGNAFAPNPSRIPVGSRGPKPPLPPKPAPKGFDPSKPSSLRNRPYGKGKEVTRKGVHYRDLKPTQRSTAAGMQTTSRLRKSSGTTQERIPRGTSGKRGERKQRGGAEYGEKTMTTSSGKSVTRQVRVREDNELEFIFTQILEDLINEGYTSSIDESFDFLNNLEDAELSEIIASYLV